MNYAIELRCGDDWGDPDSLVVETGYIYGTWEEAALALLAESYGCPRSMIDKVGGYVLYWTGDDRHSYSWSPQVPRTLFAMSSDGRDQYLSKLAGDG